MSVIILFFKNFIFTEYVAAAATSFVIGSSVLYAYSHYETENDLSASVVSAEVEEAGASRYSLLPGVLRPSSSLAGKPVSYCLTTDFHACSDTMPQAGQVGHWCVTENNRSCRLSAIPN